MKKSKHTTQEVEKLLESLPKRHKELLGFVIKNCSWGSGDYEFIDDNGEYETDLMYGYFTNVKDYGYANLNGVQISAAFRYIYSKLCDANKHQIGRVVSHCRDWWGNGSGDMLFIREEWVDAFDEWAHLPQQEQQSCDNDTDELKLLASAVELLENCLINGKAEDSSMWCYREICAPFAVLLDDSQSLELLSAIKTANRILHGKEEAHNKVEALLTPDTPKVFPVIVG